MNPLCLNYANDHYNVSTETNHIFMHFIYRNINQLCVYNINLEFAYLSGLHHVNEL